MSTKGFIRKDKDRSLELTVDDDGHFLVRGEQEIGDLVDQIRHMSEEYTPYSHHNDTGMRHAAEIPVEIYADLERRGIAQDPARMKAWLNDPDNQVWRVWKGKV